MILALALLLLGLVALTLGADRFVLAAARLSRAFGVSPVLIGALVVGLGTSAPELLVSVIAASQDQVDLALGNVVGSNTANLTLVLGATALVSPLASRVVTIRREGFAMTAGLVLLGVMLWDLGIGRIEGIVLLVSMVGAAILLIWWSSGDTAAGEILGTPEDRPAIPVRKEVILGVATLALTLVGADVFVRGAVRLAAEVGISSAFVGLVIVSVGTSLPELATALAAARRDEAELVLGNVLGSNLFNSLAVAGTAGIVGPGVVDPTFRLALGLMIFAGVLAGVFGLTGRKVDRWEGAVLLAVFLAFVAASA